MSSLIINEGSFYDLEFSENKGGVINIRIYDRDMFINKSEAEQIIKHLQEQFNLTT